ncbi:50S ribosomal protein L25/general stress protein Ctc [Anaerobacillus sp. MEB173]|uniref:50S ribosomal protein L25/general stress protein Ctc n=1 Tax=Anaerobacillus sp. MEB173 TaxID=3383345 RepID=UPI003F907BED
MATVLKAEQRSSLRKSETKGLRLRGQVPAIVYGSKMESKPVSIDGIEFLKTIRENGRNAIISLDVAGDTSHQVIVNDMQLDSLKGDIIHADFFEVDMQSEMDADVPVHLVGEPIGASDGGIVQHTVHQLSVRALPADIPEAIEINIENLAIGDSIQVRDLPKAGQYEVNNEPEEVIVSILPAPLNNEPDEQQAQEEGTEKEEAEEGKTNE